MMMIDDRNAKGRADTENEDVDYQIKMADECGCLLKSMELVILQ